MRYDMAPLRSRTVLKKWFKGGQEEAKGFDVHLSAIMDQVEDQAGRLPQGLMLGRVPPVPLPILTSILVDEDDG